MSDGSRQGKQDAIVSARTRTRTNVSFDTFPPLCQHERECVVYDSDVSLII